MEVSTTRLRELQTQRYQPTKSTHADSCLDEYFTKEFEGCHLAEVFHENTKIDAPTTFRVGPASTMFVEDPRFQFVQSRLQPDWKDRERIELPEPEELPDRIDETVRSRRSGRNHAEEGISLSTLSTFLDHSCGTTGSLALDHESRPTKPTRAYPSAGGLYPVEIYLLVMNEGDGLEQGVYYYVPNEHVLRLVKRDPAPSAKSGELFIVDDEKMFDPADSAVTVVLTATFWRSMAKYGPRGYRYVLQESGHIAQNVQLVATAMGLSSVPLAAFRERALDEYLGADGVNESTVYTIPVGVPAGGDRDE